MKKYGSIFFVFLFFLFSFFVRSQQLPPSIKWHVIITPQLKIIYPAHLEIYALKTARFVDSIYPYNIFPFGKSKRIPLVLNPYTSISNGYVTLIPRKSEWYLQPFPTSYFGNIAWYKILGIHEMRHVFQIDGINKGAIKFSRIFAGNIGQSFLSIWAYPLWFFEGDAVYMETQLSHGGRGRSDLFKMPMKMIAHEYKDKDKNYYKIYYGSYKQYYPSHYHLGYYLMDYLYRHYKESSFWDKLYKHTSRLAFIPGAFQWQLKRKAGVNYRQLTDSVFTEFRNKKMTTTITYPSLSLSRPKIYTSDRYPYIVSSDSLFFLRSGFDETPAIWLYQPQKNQLKKIQNIPSGYFTVNRRYLAWIELKTHPRWHNQTYARVRIYDLKKKKTFYLTPIDKYLPASVSLSPQKNLLAVVRYDLSLIPHLEIWQMSSRKKIYDYSYPQFESIRHPQFDNNGSSVVFSALVENKGTAIYKQHVELPSKPQKLTKNFITENIYYPKLREKYLYYQSDKNGLHITKQNLLTGEKTILIRSKYGLNTYDIQNDSLCWADYTRKGFLLKCTQPVKSTLNKENDNNISLDSFSLRTLFNEKLPTHSLSTEYSRKKYNHLSSYFNIHSWLWGISMQDDSTYVAGIMLFMNDILDENALIGGILFNSKKQFQSYVQWEYKRFFPVFGIRYSADKYFIYDKPYYHLTGYMRIPLIFSSGIWYHNFNFTSFTSYTSYDKWQFYPYGFSLSLGVSRQRAYRHVSSRWRFSFQSTYSAEPQSVSEGMNIQSIVHLPGPGKNDHLAVHGMMHTHTGHYPFYLSIPPVRGWNMTDNAHWSALHITYHAPLLYPDWGWRRLFNLKRIRYKVFYDQAWLTPHLYQSMGGQLIGDWNFFGLKPEIPFGVQVAYVRPLNQWTWSMIFMGISW